MTVSLLDVDQLNWLSSIEVARLITEGALSAEDYVQSCIRQIEREEPRVQAWVYFDPDYAVQQARELDARRASGQPVGPLHGVPVGLKDIIDTRDMPTENGTVLHAGRLPRRDAAVVSRLRQAGAVIIGKTVTAELATYSPGKTRNPHNEAHTPGGSSSGSAAAVAAGMVPLAVGTQTNGSTIRPASYCGVVGFKPTHGLIPRTGILTQSRALDQVGVFARSVEEAGLLVQVLAGYDEGDEDTRPLAAPPLLRVAQADPPVPPTLAWARTPFWDQVDEDARDALEELLGTLGGRVVDFELPLSAQQALEWHRLIMGADIAGSFEHEFETGRRHLSESLQGQIERGRQVPAVAYRRALEHARILNGAFAEAFQNFDAILTPAVHGTAPQGLAATGNPMFCTLWTLCGMPSVCLPLLQGANGLPLGIQLVGPRGDDARLLRTARWLTRRVLEEARDD